MSDKMAIFNIGDKKKIFKGKYIIDDFQNKKTAYPNFIHIPSGDYALPKNCMPYRQPKIAGF